MEVTILQIEACYSGDLGSRKIFSLTLDHENVIVQLQSLHVREYLDLV